MVGNYSTAGVLLEKRQPAWLFWPLAWLLAGPANPLGNLQFLLFPVTYGYQPWEMWAVSFAVPFALSTGMTLWFIRWAVSFAVPFALSTGMTLWFIRNDGSTIWEVALTFAVSTLAFVSITGSAYTWILWFVQERMALIDTGWPLWDLTAALGMAGSFVRQGMMRMMIAIPVAILLLRLIGLRREPKKPRPKLSLD